MLTQRSIRLKGLAGSGVVIAALLMTTPAFADNPIIQTIFTADPAPMVHGDTVYLCTSHDEDETVGGFFTMNDWYVFSSKDMVNWTDHGTPLSYETFSWATGKAWAPHCIARNGKFYFYVPVDNTIGVAVSDSPTGPFVDPIGEPLVSSYQYIDPSVFIDKDGKAYLYFGNPSVWYVRLNEDMISFEGGIQAVPMTTQSFGQRNGDPDRATLYEEGPWIYERNNIYYLMHAAGPLPEKISYSTSPGPTGPWTYRDIIMHSTSGLAFTNHAGVVDFKGRSFFFYHTQELSNDGYKRSVAVEEFAYEADGSFPTIEKTDAGVTEPVELLIPYYRVEAETIAWEEGIEVEDSSEGGRNVANIEDGDFIKVESVDFLTGAISFEATVASAGSGGNIELRLDAEDGALVGTCLVSPTGGWQTWQTVSCDVSGATGVHDLFLVFTGGGGFLFNIDWWQFEPKDPLPVGTGGADGAGGGPAGVGGTGGLPDANTGGAPSSGGGPFGQPTTGGSEAGSDDPSRGADELGGSCTATPRSSQTPWGWMALLSGLAGIRLVSRRRRRASKATF